VEDNLPRIYEDVTREKYPGRPLDDGFSFNAEEMALLREVCGEDELRFQLARELLDIERRHRTMVKRSGLFEALQKTIKKSFYSGAEDAEQYAKDRQEFREQMLARLEPTAPPEAPKRSSRETPKSNDRQLPLLPEESSGDAPDQAV
jgi:DNA sulfur modification protein DndC